MIQQTQQQEAAAADAEGAHDAAEAAAENVRCWQYRGWTTVLGNPWWG
jgi:hypothetical protein